MLLKIVLTKDLVPSMRKLAVFLSLFQMVMVPLVEPVTKVSSDLHSVFYLAKISTYSLAILTIASFFRVISFVSLYG